MIWYDIWYMIRYDIWYNAIWYMIWYMIRYDIWYDTIRCDAIRYDIWYGIWYDIWYDMMRYVIWYIIWYMIWYDMTYLLTAIGLTPVGSSTVHIYTQRIHRTAHLTQTIHRTTQLTNWEECGPCTVFASYTLAFAFWLRKKHGETSTRVAEERQLAQWKQNIQNRAYVIIRTHKHNNNTT
jgi:hypothetical protein